MYIVIEISYRGTEFYGWAKQPNKRTVQGEIEKYLSKIYSQEIVITFPSRTDRFVHAISQLFSYSATRKIPYENIKKYLENNIPDIFVKRINSSRYEIDFLNLVKSKTYLYKFNLVNDYEKIFSPDLELDYFNLISIKKIEKSIKLFIGEKDFSSFTSGDDRKNYVRKINYINLKQTKESLFIYVNGNGFLKYMVRNIIGTIMAYNDDKINLSDINDYFVNPKKGKVRFKLPGKGLYLFELDLNKNIW